MLFLVATPIGHLADMTFRAVETLNACDYILCEDTRHSLTLLRHYEIRKPLKSYHKFNEASQRDEIIRDLHEGKQIALISDAGTPGVSDPGADLVKLCVEHNLPVTAIPGACAAIQALCSSGLETNQFQFLGFLPKKEGELKRILQHILSYPGTTICYESPHRILSVLKLIEETAPSRRLVIARELTKKFEEILRGTAGDLLLRWKEAQPKGEFVLLFSKNQEIEDKDWLELSPEEHVAFLETTYSASRQEAIKIAAELRGVPKREIYNQIQKKDEQQAPTE
jgi:16S rRNA (cytidine1402-2'-O)-methyltransferase